MPLRVEKDGKCWKVLGPRGKVHATCATKKNAMAQFSLLQGIDHGWKPTGKKVEDERKEEEVLDGGKIEIVNEQPIRVDDEDAEKEEKVEAKKGKKKCPCKKKVVVGGGTSNQAWKAYIKKHMGGKKFASRQEVNEYMKKLASEFKSGAGIEPLLLKKDLGKGENISVPGPLARK